MESRVINASSTVLNTIESGYVLPLKSEPTEYHRENQVFALRNNDFVQQCIQELTDTGCIDVVAEVPFVCSPLSVVENSVGKKRLVINLRHLNRFLWKQRFRYEDLRVAMTLFEKGDYLFSFDLKAGYHHLTLLRHTVSIYMVRRLGKNYLTGNSLYCAVKRFNSMHKAL